MTHYGMFSDAGDLAVDDLIKKVRKAIKTKSRNEVVKLLNREIEEIAKEYSEVEDTAVRDAIESTLDPDFDKAGLERLSMWEI